MAQDLRDLHYLPHLSTETLQMICGLIVRVMLSAVADILDVPANHRTQGPQAAPPKRD